MSEVAVIAFTVLVVLLCIFLAIVFVWLLLKKGSETSGYSPKQTDKKWGKSPNKP